MILSKNRGLYIYIYIYKSVLYDGKIKICQFKIIVSNGPIWAVKNIICRDDPNIVKCKQNYMHPTVHDTTDGMIHANGWLFFVTQSKPEVET